MSSKATGSGPRAGRAFRSAYFWLKGGVSCAASLRPQYPHHPWCSNRAHVSQCSSHSETSFHTPGPHGAAPKPHGRNRPDQLTTRKLHIRPPVFESIQDQPHQAILLQRSTPKLPLAQPQMRMAVGTGLLRSLALLGTRVTGTTSISAAT